MRSYNFTLAFLALSASVASAQGPLASPPLSPNHSHKCPTINIVTCSSDLSAGCTAVDSLKTVWKSDQLNFRPKKPYVLEGIYGDAPAPGGGDIILSVTGCQYQDKHKKNFKLLVPQVYLPCTGTKGESAMDCRIKQPQFN